MRPIDLLTVVQHHRLAGGMQRRTVSETVPHAARMTISRQAVRRSVNLDKLRSRIAPSVSLKLRNLSMDFWIGR
jgi:hypothetical protein